MNEASRKIWVHDLSPFLVRFSSNTGVSWYGLSYLAGFLGAGLVILFATRLRARAGDLPAKQVPDFIAWTAFGTLIGGRLGYALLYAPELFTRTSPEAPYWDLLKVWEGGMASHGGIFGVLLATALYARLKKFKALPLLDLTALGASIGIIFGRLANFMNGELYGRIAPATFPWAIKFPREMQHWLAHDPARLTRLNKAIEALGGTVDLPTWKSWVAQVSSAAPESLTPAPNPQIYGVLRELIQALQNKNDLVRDALAGALTPRYPSQFIEAGLEGLAVFLLLLWFVRRDRAPGQIAAFWLFLYSVARIVSELFREPDAQIGFDPMGLTRGQWLSLLTLAVAGILFVSFSRANRPQSEANAFS